MLRFLLKAALFLSVYFASGQVEQEVVPPYHIKTVSFVQNNQNVVPIFQLITNVF